LLVKEPRPAPKSSRAADNVQGRGLLSQPRRMMEREQVDRKPEPQALRALRDCGEQQHRRGKQRKPLHEMHLGQPQGVEAEAVSLAGFLDQFGVALRSVLARD
jgi:hypothetical protein